MHDNIHKHIAKKIKGIRLQQGYTQENLSLDSGLDKAYIGHIENGRKHPTLKTLEKICKTLNIHITELLKEY